MKKEEIKNGQSSSPIIFACAGCSFAGQIAYQVALNIDETGFAEMSCLAGVASGKKSFIKKLNNKKVILIDGCPIECAKGVFDKLRLSVDSHVNLKTYGIKKSIPPADLSLDELSNKIITDIENKKIVN